MPEEDQKVLFWCRWADLPCAGEYRRKVYNSPDSPLIFYANVSDYVDVSRGWDSGVIEQAFRQEEVMAWVPIGEFNSHQSEEV